MALSFALNSSVDVTLTAVKVTDHEIIEFYGEKFKKKGKFWSKVKKFGELGEKFVQKLRLTHDSCQISTIFSLKSVYFTTVTSQL